MAKRKPIIIDGEVRVIESEQKLQDILPREVGSIVTTEGALITRDRFDRVPIPDGFETNLSTINKGGGAL